MEALLPREAALAWTPREVAEALAAGERLLLLDVRLPWERMAAELPNAVWIPLHELPTRLAELPERHLVVPFCHIGLRSAEAAAYLRRKGFRAVNLAGGIDAWSREVDASIARY
jgi:rhodanese-related sulfurtransferase